MSVVQFQYQISAAAPPLQFQHPSLSPALMVHPQPPPLAAQRVAGFCFASPPFPSSAPPTLTIQLVQTHNFGYVGATVTSTSAPFASPTTAANLLMLFIAHIGGYGINTITGGGSWNVLTAYTDTDGNIIEVWLCSNCTVTSSLTVDFSAPATEFSITLVEWSGMPNTLAPDGSAGYTTGTGSGGVNATGQITPTSLGNVLVIATVSSYDYTDYPNNNYIPFPKGLGGDVAHVGACSFAYKILPIGSPTRVAWQSTADASSYTWFIAGFDGLIPAPAYPGATAREVFGASMGGSYVSRALLTARQVDSTAITDQGRSTIVATAKEAFTDSVTDRATSTAVVRAAEALTGSVADQGRTTGQGTSSERLSTFMTSSETGRIVSTTSVVERVTITDASAGRLSMTALESLTVHASDSGTAKGITTASEILTIRATDSGASRLSMTASERLIDSVQDTATTRTTQTARLVTSSSAMDAATIQITQTAREVYTVNAHLSGVVVGSITARTTEAMGATSAFTSRWVMSAHAAEVLSLSVTDLGIVPNSISVRTREVFSSSTQMGRSVVSLSTIARESYVTTAKDSGVSRITDTARVGFTAAAQAKTFIAMLGTARVSEAFSTNAHFSLPWNLSGHACEVFAAAVHVDAPTQLAMFFQLLPEQLPQDWLIQRIRAVQTGGGFHVRGRIFQAAQGQAISCAACFGSTLGVSPPVAIMFGIPVPSIPDQPIIAMGDESIVATIGVVSGGFPIEPLDDNPYGQVIHQATGSLAVYFAAGTFYMCLCLNIFNATGEPARLIVQNYTLFDLWVTGV